MNIILLTNKDKPTEQPLVFIVPDTVEITPQVIKTLPDKLRDTYRFHTVSGDQPTVVSSVNDIVAFMKDAL